MSLQNGQQEKVEIQTREEDGSLNFFSTLSSAFAYAMHNPDVWKISFSINGERVRLVKLSLYVNKTFWVYEPIL